MPSFYFNEDNKIEIFVFHFFYSIIKRKSYYYLKSEYSECSNQSKSWIFFILPQITKPANTLADFDTKFKKTTPWIMVLKA